MNIYNGEHLHWWASIFDEYISSALFGVQIANMVLPCSQFSLHSLQSQLVSMPWILFQTKSAPVLFLPPRCPDVFPANGGGHMFPGTGLLRDICPASSSSFSSGSGSPPPPLLGVMCARPSLMRDQSGRGEQVGRAHDGTLCRGEHGSQVLVTVWQTFLTDILPFGMHWIRLSQNTHATCDLTTTSVFSLMQNLCDICGTF